MQGLSCHLAGTMNRHTVDVFDSQSLTFAQAIQWSGLSRTGFESALLERGLPVYRVTLEDLKHDLEAVRQMAQ